jgi:hypothetical protein
VNQINQIVSTIFNSFDDTQKSAQANGFTDFLNQIDALAQKKLGEESNAVDTQEGKNDKATTDVILNAYKNVAATTTAAANTQLTAAQQQALAALHMSQAAAGIAQSLSRFTIGGAIPRAVSA